MEGKEDVQVTLVEEERSSDVEYDSGDTSEEDIDSYDSSEDESEFTRLEDRLSSLEMNQRVELNKMRNDALKREKRVEEMLKMMENEVFRLKKINFEQNIEISELKDVLGAVSADIEANSAELKADELQATEESVPSPPKATGIDNDEIARWRESNKKEMQKISSEVLNTKNEDIERSKTLSDEIAELKKSLSEIAEIIDMSNVKKDIRKMTDEHKSRGRDHLKPKLQASAGKRRARSVSPDALIDQAPVDYNNKSYDLDAVIKLQSLARRWLAKKKAYRIAIEKMEANEFHSRLILLKIIRNCFGEEKYEVWSRYKSENIAVVRAQSVMKKKLGNLRAKKLRRRNEISREVLSTEESYVKDLDTTINLFLKPMRKFAASGTYGLTPESVRMIFSYIEVIRKTNGMLLERLHARMENWTEDSMMGDIFLELFDFLKSYTQYVNNYTTSLRQIVELKKDSKFKKWLDEVENGSACNGRDILSYLITPIQRIPRYVLLIKDLSKNTPIVHPDYANLQKALQKVENIAVYVNERQRKAEGTFKVLLIQEKMSGKYKSLITPDRYFVREGDILNENGKQRYAFLFNDCLVVAKKSKADRYKFVRKIVLDTFAKLVLDEGNELGMTIITAYPKYEVLKLAFGSLNEKITWVEAISAALKTIIQHYLSFKDK